MSQSLYHIQQEHLQLISLLEESGGELTDEIASALPINEKQFQEKAISYGYVIKRLEDDERLIADEIKRLEDLKTRKAKAVELLRSVLSGAMFLMKHEKIETPLLKIAFRHSESVVVEDEKALPQVYKTEKPATWSPDKVAIKKAIKAGETVPGAVLVSKSNLQIK